MRWRNGMTMMFGLGCFFLCSAQDCHNHLIDDNGFDLWCGEDLCAWEVERGDIAQVATWHEADPGVALVGDDVAITQLSPEQGFGVDCVQLDVVADIDADTQVSLEMDFEDDGDTDAVRVFPASRWEPIEYIEHASEPFHRVRFRIHKKGPGRAAFAQIEAIECPPDDNP